MAASPSRSRTYLAVLAAGSVLLLASFAVLGVGSAGAAVRAFHPLHLKRHTVSFKPKGLNPKRVRRATFRIHRHGHVVKRKVSPRRVRHALANGVEIRLPHGEDAQPGSLLVSVAPPSSPGAPSAPSAPSQPTGEGCAAGATTMALTVGSRTPGTCWRPYAASSPFNTPVGSAAVVSNSPQIVENWLSTWSGSEKTSSPRFSAPTAADRDEDYNHPLYFAAESDPVYTVHCTEPWGTCPIEGDQVHVPAGAQAASGSDGHLAVIEAGSGWEYDFWQAGAIPAGGGTLDVSWGGRTRLDGSGLGSAATAGEFGLAAGIIRPEELAAGQIDHALFMAVKCTNGTSVYPAGPDTGRSCASMGLSDANAPAMGQHFVLAMSNAEIEALPDPAWQKTVLRAMAEYGLYVGDTGGGFIKTESGISFTSLGMSDPWTALASRTTAASGAAAAHLAISPECINFEMSEAVDWREHLEVVAP